jgi:hypothetical protein
MYEETGVYAQFGCKEQQITAAIKRFVFFSAVEVGWESSSSITSTVTCVLLIDGSFMADFTKGNLMFMPVPLAARSKA